jgi:hypothetical protein
MAEIGALRALWGTLPQPVDGDLSLKGLSQAVAVYNVIAIGAQTVIGDSWEEPDVRI